MNHELPLVSVNVLTYNGQKYIRGCWDSVLAQTYPKIEILVIDNASTDETVDILQDLRFKPFGLAQGKNLRIIFNEKNVGFAGGHNQGIKESKGEFICCLNQDVVLDKDFIKEAVETFQKDEKIGAVQGKLYRNFGAAPRGASWSCSKILDHTGLVMLKNRRIIARGQGKIDKGQYEDVEKVFGVDGAAPVYRRKALEDVALKGTVPASASSNENAVAGTVPLEYFDETFFCYKEDVDLAWRMQWAGWQSIYQPKAIAWHDRTSGESASQSLLGIIQERRKIGQFAKYLSFKNQRLMQIKNEDWWLFFKHLPWILPKEIAAWLYVLFFEKYTWRAVVQLIKEAPDAWQKRKIIIARRKISRKEIEKWFQ